MILLMMLFCFLVCECSADCCDNGDNYSITSTRGSSNQTLTLREALSQALLKHPELRAYSYEVRAREAALLQAGLLPNPEFDVVMEGFEGDKVHKGFQSTETTFLLFQIFELGGKRSKRVSVARYDKSLSGWDYESKRLDVLSGASSAFIEVYFAQEDVALSREQHRIAEQMFLTVSEKVKAGKVSPIEESKARIALSTAKIELEKRERQLLSARQQLASFWGGCEENFESVQGDFDTVIVVPDYSQFLKALSGNPDLARWEDEIRFRQAAINLEKSRAVPDVAVGAGVKKFEETHDYGFVLDLSIPLPVFNRNQGNICEAKTLLAKSHKEFEATHVRIRTDLFKVYHDLSSAYLEVATLKEDILPCANSAFEAIVEGYKQGKFGYEDVLDAQQLLFSTRSQYLSSLSKYHKSFIELERLTGGCLFLKSNEVK